MPFISLVEYMLVALVIPSVQYSSVNRSENIGFSLTTIGRGFRGFGATFEKIARLPSPLFVTAAIIFAGDSGLVDNTSGVDGLVDFR